MASSWILFFSYQDDARSNTHQIRTRRIITVILTACRKPKYLKAQKLPFLEICVFLNINWFVPIAHKYPKLSFFPRIYHTSILSKYNTFSSFLFLWIDIIITFLSSYCYSCIKISVIVYFKTTFANCVFLSGVKILRVFISQLVTAEVNAILWS